MRVATQREMPREKHAAGIRALLREINLLALLHENLVLPCPEHVMLSPSGKLVSEFHRCMLPLSFRHFANIPRSRGRRCVARMHLGISNHVLHKSIGSFPFDVGQYTFSFQYSSFCKGCSEHVCFERDVSRICRHASRRLCREPGARQR